MKTKIRELDKFRKATVVLPKPKFSNEVMSDSKFHTAQVIGSLVAETGEKNLKMANKKSTFEKRSQPKSDFVFRVRKMKEKLVSDEHYIVAFKRMSIPGTKVLPVSQLPSDMKETIENKNQKAGERITQVTLRPYEKETIENKNQKARERITQVTLRPYEKDEHAIKTARNEVLKRINHLFFDFLSREIPDVTRAKPKTALSNKRSLTEFHRFIDEVDRDLFKGYPFDEEDLYTRLKNAMRKADKKSFLRILDLVLRFLSGSFDKENLEESLITIHNGFIRSNARTEEKKKKYRSTKHQDRSQKEELTNRLVHTNYYYYSSNSMKSKGKNIAIKALLQRFENKDPEDLTNFLKSFIDEHYKLDRLLEEIGTLKLSNTNIHKLIETIKSHYKAHVEKDRPLEDVEKFLLSEIHKYVKGRFRKVKTDTESDPGELTRYLFTGDVLVPKIINHVRNQLRTFTFYEGRNRIHFTVNGEQRTYDSESLQKLNRTETLFKSLNTMTTLIQLALINRMRVVDPSLAIDYIGLNKSHENLLDGKKLNKGNHHLWYDLTINHKGLDHARHYLSENVRIIKDLRMNVSHYNYDIDKLFSHDKENFSYFDAKGELNQLMAQYDLAFLRKLYNNNLSKVVLDGKMYDYLLTYYKSSLSDTMSHLPRPHKIIKDFFEDDDKETVPQEKQARQYMLKAIYYGKFQDAIRNHFKDYRDAYNKDAGFMSRIHGDTLKEAHEWLQSMVSRGEMTHNKWIKFIKSVFIRFMEKKHFDMKQIKYTEDDTNLSFEKFIEYFNAGKRINMDEHFKNPESLAFIIAASKFLRKRDLSRLKHEFEKFNSFQKDSRITPVILLIKLLLDVDLTDPLFQLDIEAGKKDAATMTALIKRDYSSLQNEKREAMNKLKKAAHEWILDQVDRFSDRDMYIVKVNALGGEDEVHIYRQGKDEHNESLVAHNHLLEAYRIGFLDIMASYLAESAIKKDLDKHMDQYSDMAYELSMDPEALEKDFRDFQKRMKKLKDSPENPDESTTKKAHQSLIAMNRYIFYKSYFEAFYITQLTNITIDLFARFAARYYQLERDYAYTISATNKKENIDKPLTKDSDLARLLAFNMDSKKGANRSVRNNFLHGNLFQNSDGKHTQTPGKLIEATEHAYKDFHYHTALRNNHNEIIPFILRDYAITARFNNNQKNYDMTLNTFSFGLKGNKRKEMDISRFTLKDPLHLDIIKGLLHFDLRPFKAVG